MVEFALSKLITFTAPVHLLNNKLTYLHYLFTNLPIFTISPTYTLHFTNEVVDAWS